MRLLAASVLEVVNVHEDTVSSVHIHADVGMTLVVHKINNHVISAVQSMPSINMLTICYVMHYVYYF